MICRRCPEGRRFASGSVECRRYGMIIREDHEGTREGCAENEERIAAGEFADNPATEPPKDEWAAIDSLTRLLQEA